MHEGDSRNGGAQIRPAEPQDRPAAGAGWFRRWLTYLVVAALSAAAGVGSAVNDTTRQMGGAIGVALIGSIVSSSRRSAGSTARNASSGGRRRNASCAP